MLPPWWRVRNPRMSERTQTPERWAPDSAADRELVLKELNAILSSYHFRGSKRYPALLKYVVDAALEGHAEDLKERTLGVEVFGRHPDYDTSSDPVVRFSASEVRKRIAQYYHENGKGATLQIELPLGSYVPEFQLRTLETDGDEMGIEAQVPASIPVRARGRRLLQGMVAGVVVLALAAGFATWWFHKPAAPLPSVSDRVWAPLLNSQRPVLIVLGTGRPRPMESGAISFYNHMTGPFHHVSVATATALANVASVVRQHGGTYEIKEDTETSLTDLRSRPVVLIGATNNNWTMRLVAPLRFHFRPGPLAQIQDTNNLQNADWLIDFSKPYSSVGQDYAIVARYYDTTTEGPVLVVAGVGPYGTEAASAFVGSEQYLEQINKQVSPGWEGRNLEVVLKSEVIDGKAGPPVLASSAVW